MVQQVASKIKMLQFWLIWEFYVLLAVLLPFVLVLHPTLLTGQIYKYYYDKDPELVLLYMVLFISCCYH